MLPAHAIAAAPPTSSNIRRYKIIFVIRFIDREGTGEGRFALMSCHAGGGIDRLLLTVHHTLPDVLR